MNYREYGKENSNVIILLHGGGLSWWNFRDVANLLQDDFHIIIPILDGHSQSCSNFTTIQENAAKIVKFIDDRFGGSVHLIGGLSLGGQILLEILSHHTAICSYAIIESALVIPSKFRYSMIKPAFGSCYPLIHRRWFAKLQFKALRLNPKLFEDYFHDTRSISKSNMIAFLQQNSLYSVKDSIKNCSSKTHIFVGEKENRAMKRSAAIIHENIQGSVLHTLPKLYHGEFSINHPTEYSKIIREISNS